MGLTRKVIITVPLARKNSIVSFISLLRVNRKGAKLRRRYANKYNNIRELYTNKGQALIAEGVLVRSQNQWKTANLCTG